MLAEDDLEAFPSGDELRRLYDLVVFPGHTEYVTEHAYDVVQRFRDLGGRLIFLSANNFFWKVEKNGQSMRRIKLWRDLGRPESALMGVQYRANDDGSRQGVFKVTNTAGAPWLFEGTGLANGALLGETVGGYGIEIDADDGVLAARTRRARGDPGALRPGPDRGDDVLRDAAGRARLLGRRLDFGGSARSRRSGACSTTSGAT